MPSRCHPRGPTVCRMGEQKPEGTGVVVVDGRNRVWVEKGAVHWRRGRRTTVVPGARVRDVRRHEKGLSLLLTDDAKEPTHLTLRHRNPQVLAALASDIDAIIEDSGERQPEVREDTTPSQLRRAVHAAGSRIAHVVRHGPPWQRCALAYVVLGAPIMLLIPVEPRTSGLEAWAMSLPGLALLGFWAHLSEFRTHLIVGWRGVTARAESTRNDTAEDDPPTTRIAFGLSTVTHASIDRTPLPGEARSATTPAIPVAWSFRPGSNGCRTSRWGSSSPAPGVSCSSHHSSCGCSCSPAGCNRRRSRLPLR